MAPGEDYKNRIKELEEKIRSLEAEINNFTGKGFNSSTEGDLLSLPGIQHPSIAGNRLKRAELASGSGNWELHLESGRIEASEGAGLLYGVDKLVMNYIEVKDIPLPEYRPLLDKALKDLISGNAPYDIEFKIKNLKSKRIIDIHSTAVFDPVKRTVFGVIRDITAKKISEELINRKNRDLELLLKTTVDLLNTADKRSTLKTLLSGANQLIGLDAGAVYSINQESIYLESAIPELPDDAPEDFRVADLGNHPHIRKALGIGSPVILEDSHQVVLTEQESLIVESRNLRSLLYIPLIASGRNYGILILGTIDRLHSFEEYDISICRTLSNIATVALENSILISNLEASRIKAEESDKLKTAFLHNVSHEIRTPLNAIMGFTGLLSTTGNDQKLQDEFVDIIQKSCTQLLNILNDIFNISQIEAGQVSVNITEAKLGGLLEDLYSLYENEVKNKRLEFVLEDSGCSKDNIIIRTDEAKLTGVLSNLLDNAVKFTSEGKITFGVTLMETGIRFFVRDTGIGIPEPERTKIFGRFYQVEKMETRSYPGAGLGLAIADAYVRLLGGRIEVESVAGEGSEFSFLLSSGVICNQPATRVSKREGAFPGVGRGKTILVAEDERSNFVLIDFMLSRHGMKLIHASNGLEAVELCRNENNIDLVLMDIKMPLMDGYEATRQIRRVMPSVPVIAQTAFSNADDRQRAIDSGCTDLLSKPFSKVQLLEMLDKHLFLK